MKPFTVVSILSAASALAFDQLPLLGTIDYASECTSSAAECNERVAILEEWKKEDVVEVMRKAGYGEGLDEPRVIQIMGQSEYKIVTEGDKLRLKKDGYNFFDLTEHMDFELGTPSLPPASFIQPTVPSAWGGVHTQAILNNLEGAIEHLKADITKLSSFWNRSYRSQWGLLSSDWVYDHVSEMLSEKGSYPGLKTSISKFSHKFVQNSVIARIESISNVANDNLIILGAHQDSLNYALPFFRSPGADDDGSGSVTSMQILRSLLENNFIPPPGIAVEFHWYAAEEGGLLGSLDIATAYKKEEKTVKAMLQLDMVAFLKHETTPKIAFFKDVVDLNLTAFCASLVDQYIHLPWNLTTCGAGCGSDHMSWTRRGYSAAFATEGLFDDFPRGTHTAKDDLNPVDGIYSFDHMLEFVKLGIAFITELSASA